MNRKPDVIWGRIRDAPLSEDSRNDTLSRVAQDLEFSALSMSTTSEGYGDRTRAVVEAVNMLKEADAWLEDRRDDDFEDARDVLDVVNRLCKAGGRKGKGKAG